MLLSAEELKSFHYQVLCNEVIYIRNILIHFETKNIAKTEKEKRWRDMFVTLESLEDLERKLELIAVKRINIKDEISFVNSK